MSYVSTCNLFCMSVFDFCLAAKPLLLYKGKCRALKRGVATDSNLETGKSLKVQLVDLPFAGG